MGIADASGTMMSTEDTSIDVSDRAYYIKSMNGENAVSDPIISKHDGSVILCFGVPIKRKRSNRGIHDSCQRRCPR